MNEWDAKGTMNFKQVLQRNQNSLMWKNCKNSFMQLVQCASNSTFAFWSFSAIFLLYFWSAFTDVKPADMKVQLTLSSDFINGNAKEKKYQKQHFLLKENDFLMQ